MFIISINHFSHPGQLLKAPFPLFGGLHVAQIVLFCALFIPGLRLFGQTSAHLTWESKDSLVVQGDTEDFAWTKTGIHLQAPTAGRSQLKRRLSMSPPWIAKTHVEMEFNPSSSNAFRMAWHSPGDGGTLQLRVGEEDDALSLWRIGAAEEVQLCNSPAGLLDLSTVTLDLEVGQTASGCYVLRWNLGSAWEEVQSSPDSLFPFLETFSLEVFYTATRTDKFHLGPLTVNFSDLANPEGGDHRSNRFWVWTEILAKPAPLVQGHSPKTPFLEALWLGPKPILVDGWVLHVNARTYALPRVWLEPMVPILLGDSAMEIPLTAHCLHLPLDLPANGTLFLEAPGKEAFGWLAYTEEMHQPKDKASGGYSLEPRTPQQACLPAVWTSSQSLYGASPGEYPQGPAQYIPNQPPLLRARTNPDMAVDVIWPHPIDPLAFLHDEKGTWTHPSPLRSLFTPKTTPAPGVPQKTLWPPHTCRCDGQPLDLDTMKWGWPLLPVEGQLHLTEILPDPLPYEPCFVEWHNASQEVLDVGALFLSDQNPPNTWRRLAPEGSFLYPNEVQAFSMDPSLTEERYPHQNTAQIRQAQEDIPAENRAELWLYRADGHVLDGMSFEQMDGRIPPEGMSWHLGPQNAWVISGDSASPGLWVQPRGQAKAGGRVLLIMHRWGSEERPMVTYHFQRNGAWTLRERWIEASGAGATAWSSGVTVASEGEWSCGIASPPPGPMWLWEIEWHGPQQEVRRRAYPILRKE
jgi:hypothetical protein